MDSRSSDNATSSSGGLAPGGSHSRSSVPSTPSTTSNFANSSVKYTPNRSNTYYSSPRNVASTPSSSTSAYPYFSSSASPSSSGHGSNGFSFRLPTLIRRALRPPTLDFETAIWEIIYLVISPTKVYKSLYYHKQTKNKWARDDPSFMILLSSFLIISALAWGLAYSPGFFSIFKLMISMVLVDFFAVGVVVATAGWLLANRFLKSDPSKNSWFGGAGSNGTNNMFSFNSILSNRRNSGANVGRLSAPAAFGADSGELEWAYCFDVHCNSFLIIWLCLYVIQFIMLPLLTKNNWFCMFLGNTLYLFAICYYFVITFYGYHALPFLHHTEFLLAPIPVFVILYVFSLFGFNAVKTMGSIYFGN